MTADEAARIILRCEQGCDIPGVQPTPWMTRAAQAILEQLEHKQPTQQEVTT